MGYRSYGLVGLAGLEAPDVLRGGSAINLASMADAHAITPKEPKVLSHLPPEFSRVG